MTSQIYSFGVIGSVLLTSGPNLPASPFAISCVCVHTWLDGGWSHAMAARAEGAEVHRRMKGDG